MTDDQPVRSATEVGERLDALEANLREFRDIVNGLAENIVAVHTDLSSLLLQLHTIEL